MPTSTMLDLLHLHYDLARGEAVMLSAQLTSSRLLHVCHVKAAARRMIPGRNVDRWFLKRFGLGAV